MNRTTFTIARILLGFMFGVLGLNGFLQFIPNPPVIPAPATNFMAAIYPTHFTFFIFGVQVICGVLLLVNRYVPLAIVTLAAILANIFAFHITMWPQTIVPMPVVALILWFVTAWSVRERLLPLLAP